MAYRTKIEVRTGGKKYLPGTILPEDISPLDLAFLKRKKFVEVVDADPLATLAAEDSDEDPDNDLDDLKETVINFQEEMEAGSDDGSNK